MLWLVAPFVGDESVGPAALPDPGIAMIASCTTIAAKAAMFPHLFIEEPPCETFCRSSLMLLLRTIPESSPSLNGVSNSELSG
jgi:hypothetical protein